MSMLTPEEQTQLIELSRRFTQNLTALVKDSAQASACKNIEVVP